MPLKIKTFLLISFYVFKIGQALGQGCSDAGICTIENIKPGGPSYLTPNQFSVGIGYGNADHGIRVLTPYISYNRQFSKLSLEGRLTSINQAGMETSVYGLSDLYLILNYSLTENLQGTLGIKLPLADGNRRLDGLPLPMDYQSSLGTFDLLMGVSYTINKLRLAAAYQQPLSQNMNSFLVDDYPADSDFRKFQSTNNYIRKGDLLLRLSYPVKLGNSIVLTPSLLPIYHLDDDLFTDLSSIERPISGSQGLTLNVNLFLDIPVGDNDNLQLNLGAPLVARQARPDGLTRSFVVNLEYQVKF